MLRPSNLIFTALASGDLTAALTTLDHYNEDKAQRPLAGQRFVRFGRFTVQPFPRVRAVLQKLATSVESLPEDLSNSDLTRAMLGDANCVDKSNWLSGFSKPFLRTVVCRRWELQGLYSAPLEVKEGGTGTAAWCALVGLSSEQGLATLRKIDWGALAERCIKRWLVKYPDDCVHQDNVRILIRKFAWRDASLENMCCESKRHLDLFYGEADAAVKIGQELQRTFLLAADPENAAAYLTSILQVL